MKNRATKRVMTKIHGEPQVALERVQSLVRAIVPHANCELEDNDRQIACAAEDRFHNVHVVKLPHYDWVEEIVRHKAMALRSRIRTGRPARES